MHGQEAIREANITKCLLAQLAIAKYSVRSYGDVLLSGEARKGRHSLAHGEKPWVKVEPLRAEPAAAGGIALRKTLCRPSRGFFERETTVPALLALGHIMPALAGLAGADTDTSSYQLGPRHDHQGRTAWKLFGKTASHRYLVVVFTLRGRLFRTVTAYERTL